MNPGVLLLKKTTQKTNIDYIVIYCYTESPSLSEYFGHMLEAGSANLLALLCVCMDVRTADKAYIIQSRAVLLRCIY